jgi:chromosome segregation ATPase
MSDQNFKQNFDNSLKRLGGINEAIQANITSKQAFSKNIIAKLSEINEKVKQLGESIKSLKEQLTTLQAQSNDNTSQIGNKSKELDVLKAQITQLTEAKTNAIAELDQIKQKYTVDITEKQTLIDQCEEKFRALTVDNAAISKERDTLRSELTQTGEQGANHAEEIKKLTAQNAQQLLEKDEQLRMLQEKNNAEMKQLQEAIAAKDTEIQQKSVEAGNNVAQIQEEIKQLTTENQSKQQIIEKLQGDITALKNENQVLIERIIAATQAINDATNSLEVLNDPTAFNEKELAVKFQEIEASIQEISSAIQGNSVAINQESSQILPQQNNNNVASQLTKQGRLPPDANIQIDGKNFTLEEIRKQLAEKKRTLSRNNPTSANKYDAALNAIQMAASQQDVIKGLQSNNIIFNDAGQVKGGKKPKKTRKNIKQKGGYTYKSNSKRRRISTTSSRRNSAMGRGSTKRH